MALALLQTLIGEHIRKGEPLPDSRNHRGRKYRAIRLPALQAAKAELYREVLASGIRKSELARGLLGSARGISNGFSISSTTRAWTKSRRPFRLSVSAWLSRFTRRHEALDAEATSQWLNSFPRHRAKLSAKIFWSRSR